MPLGRLVQRQQDLLGLRIKDGAFRVGSKVGPKFERYEETGAPGIGLRL